MIKSGWDELKNYKLHRPLPYSIKILFFNNLWFNGWLV